MPRVTPTDRLPKLLDAAAEAFIEHGFVRTQMDDIADRLGVSKGTIYRSIESKEALFGAVAAWADRPELIPPAGLVVSDDLSRWLGRSRPTSPLRLLRSNSPRSSPNADAGAAPTLSATRSNESRSACSR